MPKLAVVGYPVSHSLSPVMQTAALAAAGLGDEWTYEALELTPEAVGAELRAMAAHGGWAGVNVTVPHKQAALALADEATAAAREIGAANTLSFRTLGDGTAWIAADNTDAPAIVDAVREAGAEPAGAAALVLGAGGSARAAVWALRQAGAEVSIWNRTYRRGVALADELGVAVIPEGSAPRPDRHAIVVNTTTVGLATDEPSSEPVAAFKALGFEADQLNEQLVVVDLAYGSAETQLIRTAKDRGAITIDGLEILVRQGARSFEIWTGKRAPQAAMKGAVRPRHDS